MTCLKMQKILRPLAGFPTKKQHYTSLLDNIRGTPGNLKIVILESRKYGKDNLYLLFFLERVLQNEGERYIHPVKSSKKEIILYTILWKTKCTLKSFNRTANYE